MGETKGFKHIDEKLRKKGTKGLGGKSKRKQQFHGCYKEGEGCLGTLWGENKKALEKSLRKDKSIEG